MKATKLGCVVGFGLLALTIMACSTNESVVQERETTPAANETKAPPPQSGGPTPPRPPEYMVQQILGQKVLNHPQVAPYLHTEVPANLPLTVHAVTGLDQGASRLTAGGQPVRVTPTANEARFRFTARERPAPARARIRFEIPDEGVVGHIDLELRDYVWSCIDAQVAEQ